MNHNSKEKSNSPLVSVVIASYNGTSTIVRTIDAALKQTYPHYEIIVVDDGSTDNTREVLANYIEAGSITYYYQKNAGCGAARNYGVQQSKGSLLAFLDSDDYWHEKKLEEQVRVFVENPETIVCYTESYSVDPHSDVVWKTQRTVLSQQRSGSITAYLLFHGIITLSSAVIRRDVFNRVGGFTEIYDLMMAADIHLWLRVAPLGSIVGITTPLTFYQLRDAPTDAQVHHNYSVLLRMYDDLCRNSVGWYGWAYRCGRLIVRLKFLRKKMILKIKKLGFKKIIAEIARRVWRVIDPVVYPWVIFRIKRFISNKSTIDQVIDFASSGTLRVVTLGQIHEEIKQLLQILEPKQPQTILEIGTANGGNLFVLARILAPNGHIISLDLPGGPWGGGYSYLKQLVYRSFVSKHQTIDLIRANSHESKSLQLVTEKIGGKKIDALFIDGDHTYKGVKQDFEMYSTLVGPGGIIAFHDIANPADENFGVQQFWNEIKNDYNHREIINAENQVGFGIGVIFM